MDARQRKVLRQILINHFSPEELHTLCVDLEIIYGNIPGTTHEAKARELIAYVVRHGRFEDLITEIRRLRPHIIIEFKPQRTEYLFNQIQDTVGSDLQPLFQEFTAQLDAYTIQLTQLHDELDEWKQLHNLLQSLQTSFSMCRSNSKLLAQISPAGQDYTRPQERALWQFSADWETCKRLILWKLKDFASEVEWISDPLDEANGNGPQWWTTLDKEAKIINQLLSGNNEMLMDGSLLSEHTARFGDIVDKWLTRADRYLLKTINQINQFSKPTSLWGRIR